MIAHDSWWSNESASFNNHHATIMRCLNSPVLYSNKSGNIEIIHQPQHKLPC